MPAARASHYPIRAVARMTGLSLDTLRAWERRYQAVVPERDDRGRVYSNHDVARLKQLAMLVESGHAIGQIASLSNAALNKLRQPAPSRQAAARPAADLDPIRGAMKQYDLPAIESLLNRFAVVLPPRDLIFSIVLPLLRDVGERWENGKLRPAQEHLVSAIVRSVLGGLLRTMSTSSRGRTLLLATAAGDRHELGLLAAGVLAAAQGHQVVYLGPDLPAVDIAHATTASGTDVLLLASTARNTADRAQLRTLARLPNRIEIWAGGPQAAELRHAIGARVQVIDRLEDLSERLQQHAD